MGSGKPQAGEGRELGGNRTRDPRQRSRDAIESGMWFRQSRRSDAVTLRFTTIRTTPKQFDRVTFQVKACVPGNHRKEVAWETVINLNDSVTFPAGHMVVMTDSTD